MESENFPVRFIRTPGKLPLPSPVDRGSVDELRTLVNLPEEEDWTLFVAWLVMALRPTGPYPVLIVNGEQGSAKSTLCRMARALVDPNSAPLRRPPRNDRDLMIAASNGWIMGYDNISGIADPLSDALCSLSTGGGFATRELYSDDGEKLFDAMRPILLNGIEDIATRSDLADRAIQLILPVIPDERRQDEDELRAKFEERRPRILGALLNAVSGALAEFGTTKLDSKPRMADFARWVTAAESALGWAPRSFLRAYSGNRELANSLAIESESIGQAVVNLIYARESWYGTASELLAELEGDNPDEKTRRRQDWPKSARQVAGQLRRLAPNLRKVGIDVTFLGPQGIKNRRVIRIEKAGIQCVAPIARVADPENKGENRDTSGTGDTIEPQKELSSIVDSKGPRSIATHATREIPVESGDSRTEDEVAEWMG